MSQKTHIEAMQMAQAYSTEHPETANLIEMFIKMRTHPRTGIKIRVGTAITEGFISFLLSNLRNPRIVFSHWECEPQILIGNHIESIASINISGCKILRSEKVKFDAPLNMEREKYLIRTADGLDYQIIGTFENCISEKPTETE